ncbi:MAG: hypothetical protein R3311_17260 [Oceanisphaera sp.]|nr:hypothetical protein [Oceanisphaera sp.]
MRLVVWLFDGIGQYEIGVKSPEFSIGRPDYDSYLRDSTGQ